MKDMGWEYGERAYKRCRERAPEVKRASCAVLQEVVEESFDTMVPTPTPTPTAHHPTGDPGQRHIQH